MHMSDSKKVSSVLLLLLLFLKRGDCMHMSDSKKVSSVLLLLLLFLLTWGFLLYVISHLRL